MSLTVKYDTILDDLRESDVTSYPNLVDANNVVWQIGIDTSGHLTTTVVTTGTSASSIPTWDVNGVEWLITVDTSGHLITSLFVPSAGVIEFLFGGFFPITN